jgi:hypothetical protein
MKEFLQRRRGRRTDFKKTLDTGVQCRAEAEVPLVFRLEAVDILQFVVQRAGTIERNLGET